MIQLNKNGFQSSYNIDDMLHNDMIWLSRKIHIPVREFEIIGKQMELNQENWTRFWKIVNSCRVQERDIHALVNDREKVFTQDEFEVVIQILGTPDEVSLCCNTPIDSDGLCMDCGEHCDKIFIF